MFFVLFVIEAVVVALGSAVYRYLVKHHARDRENVPDWQRLAFWTATATLSTVFFIMMTELFNFGYANGLIHALGTSHTLRIAINIVIVAVALAGFVIVFDLISPNNGFRKWLRHLREKRGKRKTEENSAVSEDVFPSPNYDDREKEYELFVRTICYILFALIMLFTVAAGVILSSEEGKEIITNSEVVQSTITACSFAIMPISIRQVIFYLRNMKRLSPLNNDEETRRLYVKNFINKENTKL